jgi:hypothetical protein
VWGNEALNSIRREISKCADDYYKKQRKNRILSYYTKSIGKAFKFIINKNSKVLIINSGRSFPVGYVNEESSTIVDYSSILLDNIKSNFKKIKSFCDISENINIDEKFDYIVINDLNNIIDISKTLINIKISCTNSTRVILTSYNPWWSPILQLASFLKLRPKLINPSWLNESDIKLFLSNAGFENIKTYREILIPIYIPFISYLLNNFICRLPFIRRLCFIKMHVARSLFNGGEARGYSVSIVIPCKNEAENIPYIFSRIPQIGISTEIIFCDDLSTDNTFNVIKNHMAMYPHINARIIKGPGISKAENVWTGFNESTGDILFILDADLTVMPEELFYFYNAISSGKAEFINGTRLIYPMQSNSMRSINMIGNIIFGFIFTFIIGQRITDTLCGTKVFFRSDWEKISKFVGSWGIKDRWGDFDLLFGASKCSLKIIEIPVHYQERKYGKTKMISVFKNGFRMLWISINAFVKITLKI